MKIILFTYLLFFVLFGHSQNTNQKSIVAFIENKGQILDQNGAENKSVLFLHATKNGINTQLRQNGFSYDLYQKKNVKGKSEYIFDRIDIEFIGINEQVEIIPLDQLTEISNYYSLAQKGVSIIDIQQYVTVLYRNIYPNIDVVFKSDPLTGNIKYDFVIHPGAHKEDIKLRYKGFNSIDLKGGNLSLKVGEKSFKESIPKSWYKEDGAEVAINFKILAKEEAFVDIGFDCDQSLNSEKTLVIDPIPQLIWAKYIGDSLITTTKGVITDRFGYIYICGSTQSINNIATFGAYQTILSDSISDAYVSKYNSYGSVIWSTYFGGNLYDVANDVYVDTSFNVFLAGTTFSTTGIADSISYQDSIGGSSDAFLAKFNKFGQLKWASYIGGDSTDQGIKLSTDHLQNVYLGGRTYSSNGISTISANQLLLSGSMDGFIAKFDSSGAILWSTYLGGQNDDILSGLAFGDSAVYVCGQTYSTDLPINGAFSQSTLQGLNDGFITRFDPDGNMIWSTYFGGEAEDEVNGIKVFNNNIYFTGSTTSDTNISTLGAFQALRTNSKDALIAKMVNTGAIVWGTYFGGDSLDYGVDLFFELDSNLFVFGGTNSLNLPVDSINAYQTQCGGMDDAFITKFDRNGTNLWSTYYGGSEVDIPEAIAVYGNTGIYVVGSTFSDTAIVPLSQQWSTNVFNSDQEGFFTKFVQGKSTAAGGICSGGGGGNGTGGVGGSVEEPTSTVIHCPGTIQMLTVQGGDLGTDADWIWYAGTCGNGPTAGAGDTIYVNPSVTTTYFVRAESITNSTDCAYITVFVTAIVPISITSDTTVCAGSDYTLSASGIGSYNWTGPNGFTCPTSDTTFTVTDSTYQGWYNLSYADTNGCWQYDSIYLYVIEKPSFTASVQQISCFGYENGSISISANGNYNYSWNVAVTDPLNLTNLDSGFYQVIATNSYNCTTSDTFNITQPSSILLDTLVQSTACVNASGMIILYLDSTIQLTSINWNPSTTNNDTLTNLQYGNYSVSIELMNACIETYSFFIPNQNSLSVDITAFENVSCEGLSNGSATAQGIAGAPDYTYSWFPTGQTTETINNLDSGAYIVTVYDIDGCFAYDTVFIGLNSSMNIDSIVSPTLCSIPSGSVQLSVSNPGALSSITWSNGLSGSLNAMNLSSGLQSVELADTFACFYTFDFYIPIINDLEVIINPGDTTIQYGESLDLTAVTNYSGNFDYFWSPGGSLSCTTCQTTTSTSTTNQIYQVIVNDQNGCVDTAYVTIKIGRPCIETYAPSIFSPNEDGLNDTWKIIGTCIHTINTKVFNQWGEVIFESNSQDISWDGFFKESKVPNDQYSYIIIVGNIDGTSSTYKGSVRVMN